MQNYLKHSCWVVPLHPNSSDYTAFKEVKKGRRGKKMSLYIFLPLIEYFNVCPKSIARKYYSIFLSYEVYKMFIDFFFVKKCI